MKANTLKPAKRITSKRLGRGNGSGKGTYSGRGMNGQKARAGKKLRPGFEGGQTPLVQRMPKLRGFTARNKITFQVVNIQDLERFDAKASVDRTELINTKLIHPRKGPVKLLSEGEIDKVITIEVNAVSKQAQEKIEKAGGTVKLIIKEPIDNSPKDKSKKVSKK